MTSLAGLPWPRRTERLVLRPAVEADLEALFAYRRLPEVHRWLTSAETVLDDFVERYTDPDRLAGVLVVEVAGAVVGDLMCRVENAWSQAEVTAAAEATQAELGWALAPWAVGRGLATEAVGELLRICFEELGVRRVEAACFAANEPSWRLMERLGMRRETHSLRESLHRSGEWMDGLAYGLLAEEWREQHRGR